MWGSVCLAEWHVSLIRGLWWHHRWFMYMYQCPSNRRTVLPRWVTDIILRQHQFSPFNCFNFFSFDFTAFYYCVWQTDYIHGFCLQITLYKCNGTDETREVRIHLQAFINKQSNHRQGQNTSKRVWHRQDTRVGHAWVFHRRTISRELEKRGSLITWAIIQTRYTQSPNRRDKG